MSETRILKWAAVVGGVMLTIAVRNGEQPTLGAVAAGLFIAAAILHGHQQRDNDDKPRL
jgi:hypothetical protein